MEPRIQYAKTEDGVSIAYASRGEGPALVVLPYAWERFTLGWQLHVHRDFAAWPRPSLDTIRPYFVRRSMMNGPGV